MFWFIYKNQILFIDDALPQEDAFEWVVLYNEWTEEIFNKKGDCHQWQSQID